MVPQWYSIRKSQSTGFPHMLIGYMRVSTDNDRQSTDLQRDALLAAGVPAGNVGGAGKIRGEGETGRITTGELHHPQVTRILA
jgi:DNA invertase Pin-like site-specific DNA recombinase